MAADFICRRPNTEACSLRLMLGPWRSLFCGAMLLAGFIGCQGAQQSMPNPFLTADRVPSPSTRQPSQGVAQPYYPGDAIPPLPGTRSAAPAAPLGVQPMGRVSPDITPIQPTGGFASAEPAIQIPSDENTMRFASRPVAAPAVIPVVRGQGGSLAPRLASLPTRATQPIVSNSQGSGATPRVTLTPVVNHPANEVGSGLFRSPQDLPPALLRNEPTAIPLPSRRRIQLPDAGNRLQRPVAVPGGVNTTQYQVPLAAVGATTGQVQTMILPASHAVPAMNEPTPPQPSTADGFRPRRAARSTPTQWNNEPAPRGRSIPALRVTPG